MLIKIMQTLIIQIILITKTGDYDTDRNDNSNDTNDVIRPIFTTSNLFNREKNTEIDPAYFHRPEPSRRLLPGQARSIFLTADWLRGSSDANDDVLASADGGIT